MREAKTRTNTRRKKTHHHPRGGDLRWPPAGTSRWPLTSARTTAYRYRRVSERGSGKRSIAPERSLRMRRFHRVWSRTSSGVFSQTWLIPASSHRSRSATANRGTGPSDFHRRACVDFLESIPEHGLRVPPVLVISEMARMGCAPYSTWPSRRAPSDPSLGEPRHEKRPRSTRKPSRLTSGRSSPSPSTSTLRRGAHRLELHTALPDLIAENPS